MWDKPELLRMISSVLFGVCFVLVLYGALHYALHLPVFALRVVSFTAAPRQVVPAQIEAMVRNELHGNFFTVDLERTRRAFESIPWVRKVSMRRHFPWRLEISLEEHVALAHWNDAGLVSTHGEVFSAETDKLLPKFIGQPDSAAEVTQMYAALTEQLAPLKQEITEISLSPRRSWRLRLNNGMLLELGREQSKQRLARFVAVYPYSLMPMQQNYEFFHARKAPHPNGLQRRIEYVDLRYRNGFAAYLSGTANGLGMVAKKTDIGRS
ncbi:cell division protein FtsQ/DivIB [Candidatus Nitrotoga sp. 1052]|uniref:cell division protein FtsQ/DivIB n=1 Tax=Candidatus Nitrotoga sp. 1052 TaxID=2886964 RepID=UPI001EF425F2|nr:cell division protein FtsQ/DivIB [Candidatus Nitrotoga sp. 1052]CAH1087797.1 Cell division protein FtsQ [Candidatus Nitrotoga sp. 1052]